jgi:hypothetical protein
LVPALNLFEDVLLWDVAPCSLVDTDRRFRGACCLSCQGNGDGGSENLCRVFKFLPCYRSQHPSRQSIFILTAVITGISFECPCSDNAVSECSCVLLCSVGCSHIEMRVRKPVFLVYVIETKACFLSVWLRTCLLCKAY